MNVTRIDKSKLESSGYIYVFGLNIFRANQVPIDRWDDPLLIFARTVLGKAHAALHIGPLVFEDTGEEWVTENSPNYVLCPVGISQDRFYALYGADYTAYVVMEPTELLRRERAADLDYMLRRDSAALYTGFDANSFGRLPSLLLSNFTTTADWISSLFQLCESVIVTTGDGWYVQAFVRGAAALRDIESAVEMATQSILDNVWFQENESLLEWDSEFDICLMHPDLMHAS